MTNYLPESAYVVDSELTRDDITVGDIVTGRVEVIEKTKKFLVVNLGTFTVRMNFKNASIYRRQPFPPTYEDPNIYSLLGQTVRVKVIDKNGEKIIISRKHHMEDALEYFKKTMPKEFTAVITAFSELSAFLDIGAGLHGRISPAQFALVRFKNIRHFGLEVGDFLKVKNLGFNDNLTAFELSRVAIILAESFDNFKRDDDVIFTVYDPLKDGIGYLGLIDNKYPALLDSKYVELQYGEEVIGTVKTTTSKGLKLKFKSFKKELPPSS